MVSTGGTSFKEDIYRLDRTVHVIVGTPGRILDLAYKNIADFTKTEIVVMDEADKLLSIDFQPIIEKILHYFPKERQIMLFSATFPITVKGFKDKHIPECKEVNLMEELTLKGVTQYYVYLEEK